MKKLTAILALAVAGCTFALAGCGSGNSKTATTANWDVTFNDSESWKDYKEIATYNVSFSGGSNSTYSIEYDTEHAEYKTTFTAELFDWQTDMAVEDYRPEEAVKEFVYVYETELTISGKYIFKSGEAEKEFSDSVKTVAKFRRAGENLSPVYSYQKVKNLMPNTLSAGNLEMTYVEVDCEYETYYSYGGNCATVKTTDHLKSEDPVSTNEVCDLRASGYSVFDRCALEIIMRSLTKSGSHTFDVFVPQNDGLLTCIASCSGTRRLNEENEDEKDLIRTLESSQPDDYIFVGADSDGKKTYGYSEVTLGVAAQLPGPSYRYWYAETNNADISATKAVLLKAITPLSFQLGTITYSLSTLVKMAK